MALSTGDPVLQLTVRAVLALAASAALALALIYALAIARPGGVDVVASLFATSILVWTPAIIALLLADRGPPHPAGQREGAAAPKSPGPTR